MDDKLTDVIRLINNHNDVDAELRAAAEGLSGILRRKYVTRLYSALDESREYAACHPTREVMLLKALKAYAPAESCRSIDGMVASVNFINTVRNIDSTLKNMSEGSVAALSSDTGTIDETHASPLTTLLIALALLNRL